MLMDQKNIYSIVKMSILPKAILRKNTGVELESVGPERWASTIPKDGQWPPFPSAN